MELTTLIRNALGQSGLTQSEMSERSGIGQGRISEYLTGVRQPSIAVAERLLRAVGFELHISAQPRVEHSEQDRVRGQEVADLLDLADALPSRPWLRPLPPTWDEFVGTPR